MSKLKADFGVRALLAIIALGCYELIIVTLMISLAVKGLLDMSGAIAIAGLAQSPAMLAVTFYFTKSNKPTDTTVEEKGK
jgi:hypothetical protein